MQSNRTQWQLLLIILISFMLAVATGCSLPSFDNDSNDADDDNDDGDDDEGGDDDDNDDGPSMANFVLKIMDAPVDEAEAVTITFDTISVHYAGEWPGDDDDTGDDDTGDDDIGDDDTGDDDTGDDDMEKGNGPGGDDDTGDDDVSDDDDDDDQEGNGEWVDLPLEVTTINLLDFQNGLNEILAAQELPAGHYTQIRLMIDCVENPPTITVDGEVLDLFIPSGCQSGVKLVSGWDLVEGEELSLILDFDLRRSISQTGSGRYTMRPTIRVIQEDLSGSISGTINPPGIAAVLFAYPDGQYPDGDFENSTMPTEDGAFTLAALPAGTYDVVASVEGNDDVVVEDVVVTAGEVVTLDPIELESPEE